MILLVLTRQHTSRVGLLVEMLGWYRIYLICIIRRNSLVYSCLWILKKPLIVLNGLFSLGL